MKHSTHPPGAEIDVYPVGVLDDLRTAYHAIRFGYFRDAYRKLRSSVRYITDRVRAGNWRAVRNTFNGYLAEPRDWPDGLKDCGTGWTKKRALRDLRRRYDREVNR